MDSSSQRCVTCAGPLSDEGFCLRCAFSTLPAKPVPVPTSETKPTRRFAGYELLEEIGGDGAMGSVYRARDPSSGRVVALKTVRLDRLRSAEILARFRIEIASAANLDHPHLLPILDTGEHEGQCYYTMKLATGGSLAHQMARGLWTIPPGDRRMAAERQRAIARLLLGVAEGVHHAHERGVLHRDLKPANILMDEDGTAYVSDFGLAKQIHSDSDLTRTQGMVGTPSYMAPEQAVSGGRNVTARTDVWALGAILYELLTGQPPFEGEGPWEILEAARTADPRPPSTLNPAVDRDLATISLKCLEKDPARRYPSAADVASELRCMLGSEPIRARPPTRLESVTKWYRRNPVVGRLLLGLWLSLGLGTLLAGWQWQVARKTATRERAARLEADAIVLRQRIERADYELDRGRTSTRLANLAAILRQQPTNRFAALAILHTLTFEPFARPSTPPLRHSDRVVEITVSPDDQRVATASYDRTARMWDAKSGRPVGSPMLHPSGVESVRFHPAGHTLATGDQDGTVRLWNVPDGRLLHELKGHTGVISGLAFTSNGRRLVSAGHDQAMRVWDPAEGRLLAGPIRTRSPRLGISADDEHALGSGILPLRTPRVDKAVSRFDEADGEGFLHGSERSDLLGVGSEFGVGWNRIRNLFPGTNGEGVSLAAGAFDLRFSPDDLWLACAENAGYRAVARRLHSPTNADVSIEHEASVWHVAVSPAGNLLASVSSDRTARIRALDSRDNSILTLRLGGDASRSAFSGDGTRFHTSSIDGTGQGWQLPPQLPPEFPEEVAERMLRRDTSDFWNQGPGETGKEEPVPDIADKPPTDEAFDAGAGPELSLKVRKRNGTPWKFVSPDRDLPNSTLGGHKAGPLTSSSSRTVLHAGPTNISVWHLGNDGKPRFARWPAPGTNSSVLIWGLTDRYLLATSDPTELELRPVEDPARKIAARTLDAQPMLALLNESSGWLVLVLKPVMAGRSGPGMVPFRILALPDLSLVASREISLVGTIKSLELASDGQSMLLAAGDGYTALLALPDLTPLGAPFRSELGSAMVAPGASIGPSAHYLVREGRQGLEWLEPMEGKRLGRPLRIGATDPGNDALPGASGRQDSREYYTPIILVHRSGHYVAVSPFVDFEPAPARILPSLPRLTRFPAWLPGLAEGIARERIGPGGQAGPCPTDVYLEAARQISEDPVDDDLRRWGQWFIQEGLDKPVHPWTRRTIRDEVARLSEGTLEERMQALQAAPGDPAVHVRLAEQLEVELAEAPRRGRNADSDLQRARFLRERAVLLGDTNLHNLSQVLGTIQSNAPVLNPVIALRKITRKRPGLLPFWLARTKWELSDGNTWELEECATNLVALALDGRTLPGRDASQTSELATQLELAGRRSFAARLRNGPAQASNADLTDYRYVDLTDHQNADRSIAWHNIKDTDNTLTSLDRGRLQTPHAPFVVSEIVQVQGSELAASQPGYPERVQGIRIQHRVHQLHFLQGTGWAEMEGVVIGRYRVRYEDGETVEIPIRYGMDLRNWQFWPEGVAQERGGPEPAWKGPQERWKQRFPEWGVRLYVQTWRNPHPGKRVESVDLESGMTRSAPFLLGMTAEVPPGGQ